VKRALATVAWVLLLWLSGCATTQLPEAVRDGEAQAVAIAWRMYGRTDLPPLVRWKQGEALSCTDPNSGARGFPVFLLEDGEAKPGCREGYTMSPYSCDVAWHGELSFSETALAHELLHVAHLRQGIFDGDHKRPEWQPGGLLDQANAAIREAGR
jgi:hypothetical protein